MHLVEHGRTRTSLNRTITALRFFFAVTLERPEALAKMSTVHEPRKLPVVLSREQVARLIEAAANPKHQAALSVAYGASLRASEVVALKVAIANSRLIALNEQGVTFKWKDYRAKERYRHKTMTLTSDEFMRRFLLHVLPSGFHRIRHYGLIANTTRKDNLARARDLLMVEKTIETADADIADGSDESVTYVCPDCGAPMIIIDTFMRGQLPRAPPVRVGES